MSKSVTLVDFGMGNLFSVYRAFETQGANVKVASDPDQVFNSDYLVFPGVGAFKQGVDNLKEKNLFGAIKEFATRERPFLGICLGMQIMFSMSHEFTNCDGLGLIEGEVRQIPNKSANGEKLKVPHIGWNSLNKGHKSWENSLLKSTDEGAFVYFVHSFIAQPKNEEDILATVDYGGHRLAVAAAKNNMVGCQFHPERSGPIGLEMVKEFLNL